MTAITHPILRQYAILTEFLGEALGPDVEVVLHDLTDADRSVVAIANGHVSGRTVGAPLTNMALGVLRDGSHEGQDYRTHDYGLAPTGKEIRSNTLFIKEEERLIGMLCVNFYDGRYRALADQLVNQLMSLAHPDFFVRDQARRKAEEAARPAPERYNPSAEAAVQDAAGRELERLGLTADSLTSEARLKVVAALEAQGIFLLKGAVQDAASALNCSQASVYRYLSQARNGGGAE